MRVIVAPDRTAGGALAAELIEELITDSPTAVLGFATGSTPEPLYAELVVRAERGLDFSGLRGFLLDEYVGLPANHPQSYRHVIKKAVSEPLGLADEQIVGPEGDAPDADAAARRYEQQLRAEGGIDLQILGLGVNGHIAFNEPGSSFDSPTRVVPLSTQTRADNARFFGGSLDRVPLKAITQGLATISRASHLLLLAWGEHKAEAAAHAVEGKITEDWPATVLQRHPRVTVVLDRAAAGRLSRANLASADSALRC